MLNSLMLLSYSESSGDDIAQVMTSFKRTDGQSLPEGHSVANGVLYLYDIKPADAGEYACVGSNRVTGSILYTIYAFVEVIGESLLLVFGYL